MIYPSDQVVVGVEGRSNIKMTERYAKLVRQHIARDRQHCVGDVEPT